MSEAETEKVLVLGAGLSGLVAAAALSRNLDCEVTVLDAGMHPGGQVASWDGPDGEPIEVGLHILFPWYHNLFEWYRTIGRPLPLVPTDEAYHVLDGRRRRIGVLQTSGSLSGIIAGLLSYPMLSLRDKGRLVRLLFDVLTLPPEGAELYDGYTVRAFLQSRGAGPDLVAFLETAAVTIQGLFGWEASAASFLKFLRCLFGSESPMKPSFLSEPTGKCLADPLVAELARRGGTLLPGRRARGLSVMDGRVTAVETDSGPIQGFTTVISALPAYAYRRILPPELQVRFPMLCKLESAHVVAVQLHFDRRVMPDGNVYVSNRNGVCFDAVTDKAFHWARDGRGSILEVLIDAGREYEPLPDELVVKDVVADLRVYFPAVSDAQLTRQIVQRHTEVYTETRPSYWSSVLRGPETPLSNLLVAGDWTAGPYHYGMESAVISGIRAANHLLALRGKQALPIIPVRFPAPLEVISRWRARALRRRLARWL